jgi:hypothetical protein
VQQHFDTFRYVVRAKRRHADPEVHREPVLKFAGDAARDDFSFGQLGHTSFRY